MDDEGFCESKSYAIKRRQQIRVTDALENSNDNMQPTGSLNESRVESSKPVLFDKSKDQIRGKNVAVQAPEPMGIEKGSDSSSAQKRRRLEAVREELRKRVKIETSQPPLDSETNTDPPLVKNSLDELRAYFHAHKLRSRDEAERLLLIRNLRMLDFLELNMMNQHYADQLLTSIRSISSSVDRICSIAEKFKKDARTIDKELKESEELGESLAEKEKLLKELTEPIPDRVAYELQAIRYAGLANNLKAELAAQLEKAKAVDSAAKAAKAELAAQLDKVEAADSVAEAAQAEVAAQSEKVKAAQAEVAAQSEKAKAAESVTKGAQAEVAARSEKAKAAESVAKAKLAAQSEKMKAAESVAMAAQAELAAQSEKLKAAESVATAARAELAAHSQKAKAVESVVKAAEAELAAEYQKVRRPPPLNG
ncbi:hypothetical protein M569_10765 [Genlisea aurea]|uniref:Uncharacterized protein n=1 Tax=Genlisea aurea TaxID=192259 RepID=S8CHH4_9LAMI|nr:hypothetical protein M569_10765 [Genlisea aurea]